MNGQWALETHLPLSPQYWDYNYVPPCLVESEFLIGAGWQQELGILNDFYITPHGSLSELTGTCDVTFQLDRIYNH